MRRRLFPKFSATPYRKNRTTHLPAPHAPRLIGFLSGPSLDPWKTCERSFDITLTFRNRAAARHHGHSWFERHPRAADCRLIVCMSSKAIPEWQDDVRPPVPSRRRAPRSKGTVRDALRDGGGVARCCQLTRLDVGRHRSPGAEFPFGTAWRRTRITRSITRPMSNLVIRCNAFGRKSNASTRNGWHWIRCPS